MSDSQPVAPAPENLSSPSGHDGHCMHMYTPYIHKHIIKFLKGWAFFLPEEITVPRRVGIPVLVGTGHPVGNAGWGLRMVQQSHLGLCVPLMVAVIKTTQGERNYLYSPPLQGSHGGRSPMQLVTLQKQRARDDTMLGVRSLSPSYTVQDLPREQSSCNQDGSSYIS